MYIICFACFFFQAEDGIRDLVRSRGLGDVYKRQVLLTEQDALKIATRRSQLAKEAVDIAQDRAVKSLSLIHI